MAWICENEQQSAQKPTAQHDRHAHKMYRKQRYGQQITPTPQPIKKANEPNDWQTRRYEKQRIVDTTARNWCYGNNLNRTRKQKTKIERDADTQEHWRSELSKHKTELSSYGQT